MLKPGRRENGEVWAGVERCGLVWTGVGVISTPLHETARWPGVARCGSVWSGVARCGKQIQ
eukprot:scaffold13690_cov244-Ochromonas_danica.AAC.1